MESFSQITTHTLIEGGRGIADNRRRKPAGQMKQDATLLVLKITEGAMKQ